MRALDDDEHETAVIGDVDTLDQDERRLRFIGQPRSAPGSSRSRLGVFCDLCGCGIVLSERGEVLHPYERLRCRAHDVCVEWFLDPPHIGLREGRSPPGDLIHVAACDGVVPCMKSM